MTKSEFYKLVTDIINSSMLDVVQHYTVCLFSDKLWNKIEESNTSNENNLKYERLTKEDYKKS